MALIGTCLCGRVRYEITGKLGPVVQCHCRECQQASSTPFATNAAVRDKYFHLVAGESEVCEYESSPGKFRCFCGQCGSPLWSRRPALPGERNIRLGLLDGDPERRPLIHIWVSEKAAWYEICDELPRYERGFIRDP